MRSYEWVERAGRTWQLLHRDLEPDHVTLGLTMAYGRIDERPAEFGTLALLAGLLRAELQSPVEMGDGEVSVPEVTVGVMAFWTTVLIAGRRRAVLSAWERLGQQLARPSLTEEAPPAPQPVPDWARDIASRIGACTETLESLRIVPAATSADAEALLARIAPDTGACRHILIADDPYLVGAGWAGEPAGPIAPARPAPYLDTRPAVLPGAGERDLLSYLRPSGLVGAVASAVLGARIADVMGDLRSGGAVGSRTTEIGGTAITVLSSDEPVSDLTRRRAAEQLLQPGLDLPDTLIDRALEAFTTDEVAAIDLGLRLRGIGLWGEPLPEPASALDLDAEWEALATAGDAAVAAPATTEDRAAAAPEPAEPITAEAVLPSRSAVRAAAAAALQTVHLPAGPETRAFGDRRGFLQWEPPAIPTAVVSDLWGEFDPAAPAGATPHSLALDEHTLVVTWYEWAQGARGRWEKQAVESWAWIDLEALACGLNDGPIVYIVDERLRRVPVPWHALTERPAAMAVLQRKGLPSIPWFRLGD